MAADARTSSVVTPRNVRYYQTIGLLHPPIRQDGRAEYDADHVNRLVEIKRAQHNGISLEEMQRRPERIDYTPMIEALRLETNFSQVADTRTMRNILVDRSVALKNLIDSLSPNAALGWSVHFQSAVLSGRGAPPTERQIDAIRKALELDEDD